MPKKGEKLRKLNVLRAGGHVKPPKRWRDKMYRITSEEYPLLNKAHLQQIVGGIWSRYTLSTKMRIVAKYQK